MLIERRAHPDRRARCCDGDPEALLDVAGQLLAPATRHRSVRLRPDGDGRRSPTAAVSALLDSCADRESRGAAVVWRFSPASVRRAMDEGAAADELVAGADRRSPRPTCRRPLTYLIGDVHRRHGSLVVQPALCCVRSADEALLIEVAAHRSLRTLRPHLLAPTVIAFQAEPTVVLGALRAAGYLPVPADEDGVSSSAGVPEPPPVTATTPTSPAPMVERVARAGISPASGRRAVSGSRPQRRGTGRGHAVDGCGRSPA